MESTLIHILAKRKSGLPSWGCSSTPGQSLRRRQTYQHLGPEHLASTTKKSLKQAMYSVYWLWQAQQTKVHREEILKIWFVPPPLGLTEKIIFQQKPEEEKSQPEDIWEMSLQERMGDITLGSLSWTDASVVWAKEGHEQEAMVDRWARFSTYAVHWGTVLKTWEDTVQINVVMWAWWAWGAWWAWWVGRTNIKVQPHTAQFYFCKVTFHLTMLL